MKTFRTMETSFWQDVREQLLKGLHQCTKAQQDLFCKIHGDPYKEGMSVEVVVARMSHDRLKLGMDQVHRTLEKLEVTHEVPEVQA